MKPYLIFLGLILLGCSNSDESVESSNSIVGEWRITARSVNDQNSPLGECESFSIYTFNSDLSYTELVYAAVVNSDCLNNPSITFEGSWEQLEDNRIRFSNSSETFEALISFNGPNQFQRTYDPEDPVINKLSETFAKI